MTAFSRPDRPLSPQPTMPSSVSTLTMSWLRMPTQTGKGRIAVIFISLLSVSDRALALECAGGEASHELAGHEEIRDDDRHGRHNDAGEYQPPLRRIGADEGDDTNRHGLRLRLEGNDER